VLLRLAVTLRGPGVILCKVTKNTDGKEMRIRTHTGAPDLVCALYGLRPASKVFSDGRDCRKPEYSSGSPS
jgi:hypothetical protein